MNKFKVKTSADSPWAGTDFIAHADEVVFEMSGALVFIHENSRAVPIVALPPGAWRSLEFMGAVEPDAA